ncbi:hypothetical protein SNEBB_003024 [Seison nebaliae]|nr:hypothetical protein SNEBB_003024 [Seison nebaliae]
MTECNIEIRETGMLFFPNVIRRSMRKSETFANHSQLTETEEQIANFPNDMNCLTRDEDNWQPSSTTTTTTTTTMMDNSKKDGLIDDEMDREEIYQNLQKIPSIIEDDNYEDRSITDEKVDDKERLFTRFSGCESSIVSTTKNNLDHINKRISGTCRAESVDLKKWNNCISRRNWKEISVQPNRLSLLTIQSTPSPISSYFSENELLSERYHRQRTKPLTPYQIPECQTNLFGKCNENEQVNLSTPLYESLSVLHNSSKTHLTNDSTMITSEFHQSPNPSTYHKIRRTGWLHFRSWLLPNHKSHRLSSPNNHGTIFDFGKKQQNSEDCTDYQTVHETFANRQDNWKWHGNIFSIRWKKYWVILRGHYLMFYESSDVDNETKPKLILDIYQSLAQSMPEHPKRENVWCLSTAKSSVFLFQCSTYQELELWINSIHSVIAHKMLEEVTLETDYGSGEKKKQQQLIINVIQEQINDLNSLCYQESNMISLAELQLSKMYEKKGNGTFSSSALSPHEAVNDRVRQQKTKCSIEEQINEWHLRKELILLTIFRYRCYASALLDNETPNPKSILVSVSKLTKNNLNRSQTNLNICPCSVFNVSCLHAYIHFILNLSKIFDISKYLNSPLNKSTEQQSTNRQQSMRNIPIDNINQICRVNTDESVYENYYRKDYHRISLSSLNNEHGQITNEENKSNKLPIFPDSFSAQFNSRKLVEKRFSDSSQMRPTDMEGEGIRFRKHNSNKPYDKDRSRSKSQEIIHHLHTNHHHQPTNRLNHRSRQEDAVPTSDSTQRMFYTMKIYVVELKEHKEIDLDIGDRIGGIHEKICTECQFCLDDYFIRLRHLRPATDQHLNDEENDDEQLNSFSCSSNGNKRINHSDCWSVLRDEKLWCNYYFDAIQLQRKYFMLINLHLPFKDTGVVFFIKRKESMQQYGVYVKKVEKQSEAEANDLREMDELVLFNNKQIDKMSLQQLQSYFISFSCRTDMTQPIQIGLKVVRSRAPPSTMSKSEIKQINLENEQTGCGGTMRKPPTDKKSLWNANDNRQSLHRIDQTKVNSNSNRSSGISCNGSSSTNSSINCAHMNDNVSSNGSDTNYDHYGNYQHVASKTPNNYTAYRSQLMNRTLMKKDESFTDQKFNRKIRTEDNAYDELPSSEYNHSSNMLINQKKTNTNYLSSIPNNSRRYAFQFNHPSINSSHNRTSNYQKQQQQQQPNTSRSKSLVTSINQKNISRPNRIRNQLFDNTVNSNKNDTTISYACVNRICDENHRQTPAKQSINANKIPIQKSQFLQPFTPNHNDDNYGKHINNMEIFDTNEGVAQLLEIEKGARKTETDISKNMQLKSILHKTNYDKCLNRSLTHSQIAVGRNCEEAESQQFPLTNKQQSMKQLTIRNDFKEMLARNKQPNANVEKLRKVLIELLRTEQDHVSELVMCLKNYYCPLIEENKCNDYEFLSNIFGNLPLIVEFQMQFVKNLYNFIICDQLSNDPSYTMDVAFDNNSILPSSNYNQIDDFQNILYNVSCLFVHNVHYFKLYRSFCSSHCQVQSIISKNTPNVNRIFNFINAKNNSNESKYSLENLLIKPIRRILKYPLLLSQIGESVNCDLNEKIMITKAIKSMELITGYINEMQKIFEEYDVYFELIRKYYLLTNGKKLNLSLTNLRYYGDIEWDSCGQSNLNNLGESSLILPFMNPNFLNKKLCNSGESESFFDLLQHYFQLQRNYQIISDNKNSKRSSDNSTNENNFNFTKSNSDNSKFECILFLFSCGIVVIKRELLINNLSSSTITSSNNNNNNNINGNSLFNISLSQNEKSSINLFSSNNLNSTNNFNKKSNSSSSGESKSTKLISEELKKLFRHSKLPSMLHHLNFIPIENITVSLDSINIDPPMKNREKGHFLSNSQQKSVFNAKYQFIDTDQLLDDKLTQDEEETNISWILKGTPNLYPNNELNIGGRKEKNRRFKKPSQSIKSKSRSVDIEERSLTIQSLTKEIFSNQYILRCERRKLSFTLIDAIMELQNKKMTNSSNNSSSPPQGFSAASMHTDIP